MAQATFSPAYQSLYDAAMNRLRQNTARQRSLATNSAAAKGINASGVSELPQESINKEAVNAEADLAADVMGKQREEELADKRFEQQKELMGYRADLESAINDRLYNRERAARKAGMWGNVIGGVVGAGTSALLKKYT